MWWDKIQNRSFVHRSHSCVCDSWCPLVPLCPSLLLILLLLVPLEPHVPPRILQKLFRISCSFHDRLPEGMIGIIPIIGDLSPGDKTKRALESPGWGGCGHTSQKLPACSHTGPLLTQTLRKGLYFHLVTCIELTAGCGEHQHEEGRVSAFEELSLLAEPACQITKTKW